MVWTMDIFTTHDFDGLDLIYFTTIILNNTILLYYNFIINNFIYIHYFPP
jgi:hypothetical protein